MEPALELVGKRRLHRSLSDSRYVPLRDRHLDALRSIVGPAHVHVDRDTLLDMGHDETEDLLFSPDVVVRPANASEISRVLALANEERLPVTPRAGGTGLSGGALPVYGGILLALSRLNRILEIDERNLQAVVEPGVVTETFQNAVEEKKLFYPPDPASRGSCHLGGNLAECSGGPRAVKYGVTKDYVLGLQAVLPTGEIVETGGRCLKNVSGYNLHQLLIGSEGTLGVITRITFRLIPLPRIRRVLLVPFPSPEAACETVGAIFRAGITPSAAEFMEKDAVTAAEEHLHQPFPGSGAAAHLLLEVDGNLDAALDHDVERIAEICVENGADDALVADDAEKMAAIWRLRRCIGLAVKSISVYKEEDTVVPRAELPKLFRGVKEITARHGLHAICYGHAGDGNLHVNLLKRGLSDAEWDEKLEPAIREVFALTVSLGGTISGEHGIGWSQKSYLPIALGAAELEAMARIKRALDPNAILNPGKIFA